jgi:ubiquitin C-terminal hydrolase
LTQANFHFLSRLNNDGATCYLNVIIQSLSGRKIFVQKAEEEGFSATASSFANVMKSRQGGSAEAYSAAAREFRLLAATTINAEYKNPGIQMDCRELLLLLCQTIEQEVESNRAELGLPPEPSFAETEFKLIVESLRHCTS